MVLPGARSSASASVNVPLPQPRSAHVVGPSDRTPLFASKSTASLSCMPGQYSHRRAHKSLVLGSAPTADRHGALTPLRAMATLNRFGDPAEFSLVLGGPLYQLFRKTRLEGDHLELLYRRILVLTALAWVPLLILATFGPAAGGTDRLSFFRDVEVHVRFLIALPALIAAELIVHARLSPVVRRFVERRIVLPEDVPKLNSAVESALRLRNSVAAEVILLAGVYSLGLWLWHGRVAIETPTWYARTGGRWALTPAGYWYVFVSIPIAQFILLRWYMRFFIWFRFLWRVSRIKLNLIPTHPDRCGGLGFIGKS